MRVLGEVSLCVCSVAGTIDPMRLSDAREGAWLVPWGHELHMQNPQALGDHQVCARVLDSAPQARPCENAQQGRRVHAIHGSKATGLMSPAV